MSFRPYQQEAFDAIKLEHESNNKCLVKMFCGTGKSLIMRSIVAYFNEKLSVFVFPSLCLIDQFYEEYLGSSNDVLKISSDSTTDVAVISEYPLKKINKVICITYQSFNLLLDNLQDNKIDVCCFDEAHHAVGHTYQKLIFNDDNLITKQIFFTATPKNANGIVMYDKSDLSKSMCGKSVYDYSYIRGMNEEYLNPIDFVLGLLTEYTNKSVYESIARSILRTGNNRVLTFHTTVNSDVDSSIKNFVDENLFIKIFDSVVSSEFPSKEGLYKKITMIGLDATISMMNRKRILKNFKKSENSDSELNITILCSCETIGEGIDTSDANMCVFVDPKSSVVKIIQNIGRIVRKQFGVDKPNSTVLIPCLIDKWKYENCSSVEEHDKAIREDMSKGGNFGGILNVMSALKQEQEDLFDACITYHNSYSQTEIELNFANQGYKIDDVVGDGKLIETIEYMIDKEVECDDIGDISVNENICIEIYNDLIEEPVSKYNEDCDGDVVRLYKTGNDDENGDVYQPIIKKNGEKKKGSKKDRVETIDKNKRPKIIFQCNSDVKVLWSIKNWEDSLKSCLLDCEVLNVWDENLSYVSEFFVTNKRRPLLASKDNKEKVAAKWLSHNITNYKRRTEGMKKKERYDKFGIFLEDNKQYFLSSDETYNINIDKLQVFIDINKRLPSSRAKNRDERYLSTWYSHVMYNYRNKIRMLNEEWRNIWGKFVEDNKQYFKNIESDDDKFNTNVERYTCFMHTNKKRPSLVSKDEVEKHLGI
jgi:superfamily II DNA or RNA helicase